MTSIGERIKAHSAKAREQRILLPVPDSDVSLLCRTLTQEEISTCHNLGERIGRRDSAKVSRVVSRALLAVGTLEIWYGDEAWSDDSGRPLTFDDDQVHSVLEVADRLDAVQGVVGRDGDIDVMAKALMRESGFRFFDDDYQAGDPPT